MEEEARAILGNSEGDPTARLLAHISLRVSEMGSALVHLANAMVASTTRMEQTEAQTRRTDEKVNRLISALETSYDLGTPPNFDAVKGTCNGKECSASRHHLNGI